MLKKPANEQRQGGDFSTGDLGRIQPALTLSPAVWSAVIYRQTISLNSEEGEAPYDFAQGKPLRPCVPAIPAAGRAVES